MRSAVIWAGGSARVSYMMYPALRTVAAAFTSFGFTVTTGTGMRRLLSGEWLLSGLTPADAFVWIGVFDLIAAVAKQMKVLTERGFFTVFYATESHEIWDTECSLLTKLAVREVWQYTAANVARCPSTRLGKPVRLLPPG